MSDQLAAAILRTLHYADIFDYPLTREELQRYLIGARASCTEVEAALGRLTCVSADVARVDGFLTLPRRQAIVAERVRLRRQAQQQMPRAQFYARLLAYFPFVRMVALTGSLAMQNARDHDIDYLIICAPGRLWTVRGLAVALVRLARLWGDQLCPNFLLSETALKLSDQNLYSAHEIIQMIPFYGLDVYCRLRQANAWVNCFLPNAADACRAEGEQPLHAAGRLWKRMAERALGSRLGEAIERWEMTRKIKKLSAQVPPHADGLKFTRDVCRGFFGGHSRRVLAQFDLRTREMPALACHDTSV